MFAYLVYFSWLLLCYHAYLLPCDLIFNASTDFTALLTPSFETKVTHYYKVNFTLEAADVYLVTLVFSNLFNINLSKTLPMCLGDPHAHSRIWNTT